MPKPALISVDWGTSSLRCALLAADGTVIGRRDGGPGILPRPTTGFEPILAAETAEWRSAYGNLPILMSGMIGSRQGWAEAPYLPCPADTAAIAGNLFRIEATTLGPIAIVPGLAITAEHQPPEVMRGEETQILGALVLRTSDAGSARHFVLPGTHSKWAVTTNGAITHFATYMTGEVFAALRHHTILGRLMPDGPTPFVSTAFDHGIEVGSAPGHPGDLLNRAFSTRTLGLFDRLPADALESYLSGLLIGAEIAAATHQNAITIIGNTELSRRYQRAATLLHLAADVAPPDCACKGHWLIATAAGLIAAA